MRGTRNPTPLTRYKRGPSGGKTCACPIHGGLGRKLTETPQIRLRTLAQVATYSRHAC